MSQSKHVLLFGIGVATLCIGGAVALAYAPGEHEQSVNILLGTALPAGIAAAAGAFQGTQQNQRANTIVTGGMGTDAPEDYEMNRGHNAARGDVPEMPNHD